MDEQGMQRCIVRKRDGGDLAANEWKAIVAAFMSGAVGEAQMASLAMACVLRGMSFDEAFALTQATVESGDVISFGSSEHVVDKHSSGGVSDIVSLVAVPIAAACGARVAKLSGRALGHTGGTIDKLEAIPGLTTELSMHAFVAQVERIGCAIAAQTPALVPADKRLYALRDRTGTVPSLGLIAASIVSKKIAGGASSIVFDVKTGAAAFMQEPAAATELATWLVEIAARFERHAQAFVTDMSQPLGSNVGTGIEIVEAREFLKGNAKPRARAVATEIAAAMVRSSGACAPDSAQGAVERAIDSGAAYQKFCELIAAQRGDVSAFERMQLGQPSVFCAQRDGFVAQMDVVRLGYTGRELAASDPLGGLRVLVSLGERVDRGQPLIEAYGAAQGRVGELADAFTIAKSAQTPPAIYERSISAMR